MITNRRRYAYSFAELLDRLSIVILKLIYSPDKKEEFEQEISDIVHDIQLDIDEGVAVTGEIIRATMVLTLANMEIWKNEDFARLNEKLSDKETADTLTYTHSMNSTRCDAKIRIQNLIGGRIDPKINYRGGAWKINWETKIAPTEKQGQ